MTQPGTHRRESAGEIRGEARGEARGETRGEARKRLNQALHALPDLRAALSTPDPYSPGFGQDLERALDLVAAPYWPSIRTVFPELSPQEVLRHAWAAATRHPLPLASLYRSVMLIGSGNASEPGVHAQDLCELAQKLKSISISELNSDPVAKVLVSGHRETPPDLSSACVLMHGMRVRYALASRLKTGAKIHELLRAALEVQGASLYLRRRELLRMLSAAESLAATTPSAVIEPFEATQFLMRDKDEHQLVLSSPELIKALLPPSLSRRVRLSSWVSERRAHRDATTQMSARLFEALEMRDFDLAEQLLRSVRLDPLARAALRNAATNYGQPLGGSGETKVRKRAAAGAAGAAGEVSARESADGASPDSKTGSDKSSDKNSNNGSTPSSPRQWKPMSRECLALVKSAFARRQIAQHWLFDGSEIAATLRSGTLPCSALSALERSLLDETWSQPEKVALVMAGVHEVFSDKSAAWTQLPLEVIWDLREKRKDIAVLMAKRLRVGVDAKELLELLSRRAEPLLLQEIERHTGSRKAKGGFAASVIKYAGTPAWHAAGGWNLHKREASLHLLWHAESGAPAVDPKAFTQAATEHLVGWTEDQPEPKATPARTTWARRSSSKAASGTPEPPNPTAVQAAAALCNASSGFLQLLVERASKPWLKELIPQLSRLSQLKYLQEKVPAEFKSLVLRARALKTKDPKRLILLLQDGARAGLEVPWSPAWKAFVDPYVQGEGQLGDGGQAGGGVDTAALQVLAMALRRNVKQLKAMASKVPDPLMRRALRDAAFSLRGTPGKDPVLLELGAHVGLDHLPHLAAAMVAVEHGQAPGRRVDHCYHQWQLPKNSGGTRTISAPIPALKRAQRALLDNLLTPLGAHRCAYGFVKGRSIKDNAALHVGREIVVNADVSNCFPSVRWPLVLGALRRDFAGELSAGAIGTILDLCTAEGGLPIGAPTSPALLNRVLLKTDEILEASAQERGCLYSRYADDITFSGDHGAVKLLGVAKGVLGRIGLNLDPRKTNIFRRGRRQVCTGLVVNEQVSVPRRVRRRLRAAVHHHSVNGKSTWHGLPQSPTSLKGRLAFVGMVHPQEAAKLLEQLAAPPEPSKKAQPKGRKST